MSKYEVQSASNSEIVTGYSESKNSVTVTTTNPKGNYQIFINGIEKETSTTLPYQIKDLIPGNEYEICLVSLDSNRMIGNTYLVPNVIEVDGSGFNENNTYYVMYDADGTNERILGKIEKDENGKIKVPNKTNGTWYDYNNKIWANLVTVNGEEVTYWTYIPRYEYKTTANSSFVDMHYIPIDKTKPSGEFKIPESFQFGTDENDNPVQLYGYWMSKYEVQNSTSLEIPTGYSEDKNSVTITTTAPNGKYQIFLDGKQIEASTELPHKITGLKEGQEYEVCVVSVTNKRMLGNVYLVPNEIEVDGSGFNENNTYYVMYDADGTNERIGDKIELDTNKNIKIPPSNKGTWYDYKNKIWANIVTINDMGTEDENDDLTTYWTYIPRYEYKVNTIRSYTNLNYISKNKTIPSPGYKIPESFQFGTETDKNGEEKPIELKGYWISKYEVQNK